jgi:hypothetical protein
LTEDPSVSVRRWVEQAKGLSAQAFRAIAEDALARVKELTPVDTGYLRNHWSVTRQPLSVETDGTRDANPQMALNLELAGAALGDVLYIVNPTVYARVIEYGFVGEDALGRKINRAGVGMVQQTVKELPQIADRAVRRIVRSG